MLISNTCSKENINACEERFGKSYNMVCHVRGIIAQEERPPVTESFMG